MQVTRIIDDRGAIVGLAGGRDALIHISELSIEPVERVEDVVKVGDIVTGIVISDAMGKYRVSMADIKRAELGLTPKDRSRPMGGRGRGDGRGRGRSDLGGRGRGDGRGRSSYGEGRGSGGEGRGPSGEGRTYDSAPQRGG